MRIPSCDSSWLGGVVSLVFGDRVTLSWPMSRLGVFSRLTRCVSRVDVGSTALKSLRVLGMQGLVGRLKALGWTSLEKFAFAVQAGPRKHSGGRCARRRSSRSIVGVRRILMCHQTRLHVTTWCDLRRQATHTEDDAPRSVSLPQKKACQEKLCKKLSTGASLTTQDVTISHSLRILKVNVPSWTSCEHCPSFSQEQDADSLAAMRQRMPDNKKVFRSAQQSRSQPQMWLTFLVHVALQKRGLAAEIAGVRSFSAHERIRRLVLHALVQVLPDSRHAKPTLENARITDTFLWRIFAKEETKGSRVAGSAGTFPMDKVLDKVLESPALTPKLQPLHQSHWKDGGGRGGRMRGRAESSDNSSDAEGGARAAKRKNQRVKKKEKTVREKAEDEVETEIVSLRRENEWVKAREKEGPKGKVDGKGKAANPLSGALLPWVSMTPDGKRLSMRYNLGA